MMTVPRAAPIVGFFTQKGRFVCRDPYCVKMIEAKGDMITRIIKITSWDHAHCDFCQETLRPAK
jgi:hypothetical protein